MPEEVIDWFDVREPEKPGPMIRMRCHDSRLNPTVIGQLFAKPGNRKPPDGFMILTLAPGQMSAELFSGRMITLKWTPGAAKETVHRYWCKKDLEEAHVLFAIIAPQKRR